MIGHELMHGPGQAAKALSRDAQHRLRCLKAVSRCQLPAKLRRVHALHDPGQPLQGALSAGVVIPGVDQIEAVNPAPFLVGTGGGQQKAGIIAVGGGSGAAFTDHLCFLHGSVPAAHFRNPAAVEGGQGIASGQIKAKAHTLAQTDRGIAGIFQHRASQQRGGIKRVV